MYNCLIVDDETIILSGIKFLIDWEKNDCAIMDTARNGRDALEKIRSCPPDIVLCDINMPVLNGMELLKICNEEFPSIVFVMLTNLQEFDLARDAIRYRAADYLLKVQLEAPALEESLQKAKKEYERRSKLAEADRMHFYDEKKARELVRDACLEILFSPDEEALKRAGEVLDKNHMLEGYGLVYIPFDYSEVPNAERLDAEARRELTAWEKELATRLCETVFGSSCLFISTGQTDCLTLFVWHQGKEWESRMALFSSKFSSASRNITQALPSILVTGCFYGKEQLSACRNEYFSLIQYFYLDELTSSRNLSGEPTVFEPLGLAGIGSQLENELNAKNLTGCTLLLDRAIRRIQETTHQKSQAIWLCNELYRCAAKALQDSSLNDTTVYAEIENLMTSRQVVGWIEKLKNSLTETIWQEANLKSEPVEKARQYVLSHIEDRLSLQDVADEVCISPGYLSTLFKKQYSQSFVSFINQAKVEHACRLIQERKYLISEISCRLSFENAYYFAKVFKRYMGMTPSEYEKSLEISAAGAHEKAGRNT